MGFRARSLALLAVATVALGGCTAVSDPASSAPPDVTGAPPSATPTASATTTPTPTPTPAAAAVPATCEALLPLALVSETEGEAWYDSGDPVEPSSALPGPSAREAAAAAERTLACRWWPELATENYLLGYAFEMDAAARAALVDDLDGAESYTSVDIAGADVAFSTSDVGGEVAENTLYAFVGDVWIVFIAPATPIVLSVFGEHAVEAALAAA